MGYVTPDFYQNEYKGVDVGDDFERLEERASDVIDQIIGYQLKGKDLDADVDEFIAKQVRKAVCSQIEYIHLSGGVTALHEDGLTSVSVGNFSYQEKDSGGTLRKISRQAYEYLKPTGLLYSGIRTVGGYYYD